jgi:hypothetical protein
MRKFLLFLIIAATLALPALARAQAGLCAPGDSTAARDTVGIKPDVLFRATVQQLKLLGCPSRDVFVVTTRSNLPTPVQPGVTYRDAVISIEIRSYVRCIAAAAANQLCSSTDTLNRKRRQ